MNLSKVKWKNTVEKITVCAQDCCTGCMACVDVCPKEAICIVDTITAYNALIDGQKCIECGACHKICQNNRYIKGQRPIFWKQGWARDDEIRKSSSSGGLLRL